MPRILPILILALIPCAFLRTAAPPNVVIVYADDLGIGDVTCYNGESKIPTPSIDQLASEGMRFTDAHSGHCLCSPSRYALLMGRYSWRGPLTKGIVWHWGAPALDPDRTNMATLLKDNGYQTFCVGKWHLGWNWPSDDDPATMRKNKGKNVDFTKPITGGPVDYGFDYYYGEDVINLPPFIWIENDKCLKVPTVTVKGYSAGPGTDDWNSMDVLPRNTAKCVEIIKKMGKTKQPFFLYFPQPSPHLPHVPTPEFAGKTKVGKYGDYVCQTDDSLGQIVKALKDAGVFDNTLLIFTSDNGSHELKLAAQGHRANGIYRGRKHENWEGGYRMPMVVTWPDRIKAGQTNDQLVSQIDLLATFADLLAVKLPAGHGEDSNTMLPSLLDPHAQVRDELIQINNGGKWAIRKGDWKYFENISEMLTKMKNGGPALYNLESDPGEQTNLLEKNPDIAAKLKARLETYKQSHAKIHARRQPKKERGAKALADKLPVAPARLAIRRHALIPLPSEHYARLL